MTSSPIKYNPRWAASCCFCHNEALGNEPDWLFAPGDKGFVCFSCQRKARTIDIGGHPAEVLDTVIPVPANPASDIAPRPVIRDITGARVEPGMVVAWPTRRSSLMNMNVGIVQDILMEKGEPVLQVWLWLVEGRLAGRISRLSAGIKRVVVCSVDEDELARHIAAGDLSKIETP